MGYNYIEDLKNIKDLRDIGGTATCSFTAFHGMRIRASDDGDRVFYQYVSDKGVEEIQEVELEYFGPHPEILDILNMTEGEFVDDIGECTPGFRVDDQIYLLDEFMRDDFGK